MRISGAIVVAVSSGLILGFWRGPAGLEMLSSAERIEVVAGLGLVIATTALLANRTFPRWVLVLAPVMLFAILAGGAWLLFEPRFHLSFYGNGLICAARAIPAALFTFIVTHFVLKIRPILAAALLAAVAAILSQSIDCPIVETRHTVIFHATALLSWPLIAMLVRA